MNESLSAGRNAPCPCGSGKKFKHCCERAAGVAAEARRSPWMMAGLFGVGLAVVATAALRGGEPEKAASAAPAAPISSAPVTSPPIPMGKTGAPPAGAVAIPPGPAPEGKVWSPEHGHFHDAPGAVSASPVVTSGPGDAPQPVAAGPLTPEPDGPAPAGKVWSPEHGHYHDVQVHIGEAVPAQPDPAPPAPPAENPGTPPK
jgi:hypothetical protein